MPVRNQNWYDLQAGRRYPLDDTSTGVADNGDLIDDSIIVDCNIKFPATLGANAFIQAITVSNTLVTVLIGVANAANNITSVRTIAAVSVVKPAQTNRNYAITPLVAGVAGWVVFGAGIGTDFTAQYASPQQSLIAPRCARAYRQLPISSLGKVNLDRGLVDIVTLSALAPIVATRKIMPIAGQNVEAIEFRLAGNLTDIDYNPLEYFLGACGQRPESGTCPKQPIESINGIKPDCNGNINIVGDGISVYPFIDCGGMGVDLPLLLPIVCGKKPYEEPRRGVDECVSSSSSSSSARSSSSATAPIITSSSTQAVSSSSSSSISTPPPGPILTLPVCADFAAALDTVITTRSGRFVAKQQLSPVRCIGRTVAVVAGSSASSDFGSSSSSSSNSSSNSKSSSSSSSSSSSAVNFSSSSATSSGSFSSVSSSSNQSSSSEFLGPRNQLVCAANDVFSTNIATLKNHATDWNIDHRITTEFKIALGTANNAGLVFNYIPATTGNGAASYLAAVVDIDRGTFMLLRYNGSAFVAEYTIALSAAGFVFDASKWHKIAVTPSSVSGSSNVSVLCELTDSADTKRLAFRVTVANYGALIGSSGLFADKSYTSFNALTIE